MRNVVITRHGPPEVLELQEAPDPAPGDGDIRIAVRAAGVNFADVLARLGLYPDAPKPPVVVGYEVSGVIDAIGAGVTTYREGDRVVALTRFGGYADLVVVEAAFAFPVPAGLDDVGAAALPVNYLTALLALYRLANIVADHHVSGPKLVLGDFNEWMKGLTTKLLSEKLNSVDLAKHLVRRRTYPGVFPFLHLDHIYYAGKVEILHIELPRTRLAMVASDHLPLVADVRIG